MRLTGETEMHGIQPFQDQTENSSVPAVDSSQLSEVASRYAGVFFRRAYGYLHNREDAEDAVQEALLSAHRSLPQFKGNARLSTWVMAIVINSARQHFRRRTSYTFVPFDVLPNDQEYTVLDLRDPGPNPEEAFADAEHRRKLLRALARLPTCLGTVYRMRDLEGKTTTEVAQALGLSEGTVNGYLWRACIQLARKLHGAYPLRCSKARTIARQAA